MNFPDVQYLIDKRREQRYTTNSVIIVIDTISDEIHENPTTGRRTLTGRSTPISSPVLININLRSSRHGYIVQLLRDQLVNHGWLCAGLASKISEAAIEIGFGRNGFVMEVFVKITYQTVVGLSAPPLSPAVSLRAELLMIVLLGRIRGEEFKRLKMETESCSICLDNLTGSSSKHGFPTRMTCSHVFHDDCLLEWLHRKNTCPLCRTVLHHR